MNAKQPNSKWIPIVRGDKTITMWIEVFRDGSGRWSTVPGVSRTRTPVR
jgi:hypothetical protein